MTLYEVFEEQLFIGATKPDVKTSYRTALGNRVKPTDILLYAVVADKLNGSVVEFKYTELKESELKDYDKKYILDEGLTKRVKSNLPVLINKKIYNEYLKLKKI